MERHLVTKIATDAAITFKLREAFAQTNDATLARLLAHDERVEACLDALRIAGGAGFRAADAELSRGPEGAFPYAVLAIERGDDKALSQLFGRVERQPETAAVVASALAWADVVDAREVALTLADPSCAPALRRLGIDALGRSGSDAERAIEHALTDRDPGVAASAARAAGTLGRDDLLDVVSAGLGSSEVIVRRWSAWASVALGRRDVCDELWIWIAEGASDHVLFMAVAATSLEEANERLGRAVEVPPELVERPSEAELVGALRSAAQRSRRGAASALALAKPESPVFDVFAPAPRQVEKLARHFGGGPGLNRSLRKRWTWPSCT